MIIFGVDPGTICTGFGVVRYKNNEFFHIASGIIKPKAVKELAPRLDKIYDELNKQIKLHSPDAFSLETAFYGKNVQSALKIGYARGVAMLAAVHNGLDVNEYSPREVKKSVVGKGAATKEQVQYMIVKILQLKQAGDMKLDESDALAVSICHGLKQGAPSKKSGSWKSFVKANPDKIIGDQ